MESVLPEWEKHMVWQYLHECAAPHQTDDTRRPQGCSRCEILEVSYMGIDFEYETDTRCQKVDLARKNWVGNLCNRRVCKPFFVENHVFRQHSVIIHMQEVFNVPRQVHHAIVQR